MHSTVGFFIALYSVIPAFAQQKKDTTAVEGSWSAYGYIALGVIVLIIIIVVLLRKQYRKFNE